MIPDDPLIERIDQLLADRALQGLDPNEQAELERLSDHLEAEGLPWDLAVAEADLALSRDHGELPEGLRIRLESDSESFFTPSKPGLRLRSIVTRSIPWLGWMAAAALLLMTLQARKPTELLPQAPGATLMERLAGVEPRPLPATEHPLARGASGTMVWSGERQEGYLAIKGLAETDPAQGVYQLWIFDATRDDRFPVDGGTFTIADANTTTFVPIQPRLKIRRPTLFAVTLEPPGGVVVSDRKRLLLAASVSP